MTNRGPTPRLEIDLDKIFTNASIMVSRLKASNISVTGVTKAYLGAPEIARVVLQAGVQSLGDSRIENIERMREAGISERIMLIRSPMISQADRVVASADISVNTEMDVLSALSKAALAANKVHGVLIMVELGDLREGVLLKDVENLVQKTCKLPNIKIMGLGANLACRNGVSPDNGNMSDLSHVADRVAHICNTVPMLISGGNSANLDWVFNGGKIGRINNLRIGEAILLGRETLERTAIEGLHTDAIRLVAEVIERKTKPTRPWGTIAQSAFYNVPSSDGPNSDDPSAGDKQSINQTILALGRQDVDPDGLQSLEGFEILDASSDHLIIDTACTQLSVGSDVSFQLNYSALLRAMTSPFVTKMFIGSKTEGEHSLKGL